MILYELICDQHHTFESWFRDSAAFDTLAAAGGVSCPVCGSTQVHKALMAPRLARRKGQDDRPRDDSAARMREESAALAPAEAQTPAMAGDQGQALAQLGELFQAVREHVEKNCDYVGRGFADEARRIHYGEAKPRGIYGETSPDEAKALQDEGVEFLCVPGRRSDA